MNGAEGSGGQVVRMGPGCRLAVPAKTVGFVGWEMARVRAGCLGVREPVTLLQRPPGDLAGPDVPVRR